MSFRLITDDFRVEVAKTFAASFSSNTSLYYLFSAKTLSYDNDDQVTEPINSVTDGFYNIFRDMIFGKVITPSDVCAMIRNVKWESGRTYDMYDDTDPNLAEKDFFVVSQELGDVYSIFKCIYNGRSVSTNGTVTIPPATSQPLSTQTYIGDEFYRTSDGYVWKLIATVDRQTYDKFATNDYAPLPPNFSDVEATAVNGKLDLIEVRDPGTNYNAYAYGAIKQASVAGDPKIFSLQTDQSLDIITFGIQVTSGSFITNHTSNVVKKVFFKRANGSTWSISGSAVSATVYALVSQSTLRVLLQSDVRLRADIVSVFQTSTNTSTGTVTASATIEDIRRDLAPDLSANTDFYKNSSFYIRSGRGAGQLRSVTEYIVTGNERRVLIDAPFTITPDTTSRFEIGPRIIIEGDGTGSNGTGSASAVATVNPSGNTISSIEIIDPGKSYTAATVTIVSNTGFVDINTGLSISASEADAVAIIGPPGGHGSDVLSELKANAVGISVSFITNEQGKLPVQNDYRTLGILKGPTFANTEIQIADSAFIFADGDIVTQPSTGVSAEVSSRQQTTLRLRGLTGFLETGTPIVSSDGQTQSVINSIDRTHVVVDQRVRLTVEVTNLGPQGTGFLLDELVTQPITNASGYIYSVSPNRHDLVGVRGVWNVSDDASGFLSEMVGSQSGAVAKIIAKVDGDLTVNSGKVVYIENFEPIERGPDQIETLKVVLKF
jgi:hypothetical protein